MTRGWSLAVLVLTMGCGQVVAEEARGDALVASGEWAAAHDALQAAGHEPRVLAKRADAALQAGRWLAAASDWTRLGVRDSTRRGEAAAGLARTAAAAAATGDRIAMASALRALTRLAPEWPVGRLALGLNLEEFPAGEDVIDLAPVVLAAVPSQERAMAALLAWGRAEQEAGRCDRAAALYGSIERRSQDSLGTVAATDHARCLLASGLLALEAGDTVTAELDLGAAVRRDAAGAAGRRALIGLGDVHHLRGEVAAAQLAWRTAAGTGGTTDSLTILALERLRSSEVVDSTNEAGIP
jgi:hypothetical protein